MLGRIEVHSPKLLALEVHVFERGDARQALRDDVLEPGNGLHAVLLRLWNYIREHIVVAELGRTEFLECSVSEILPVVVGVATADEGALIVSLLAMVGER